MAFNEYNFSVDWFSNNIPTWTQLLDQVLPTKILEIGSFEGRSTCFLIDYLSKSSEIEIHCVDTWEGGIEHKEGGVAPQVMSDVECRFHHNVDISVANSMNKVKLEIHKGYSDEKLSILVAQGFKNHFDLVYIDGSHQAPDVLIDAVLSFKLLKVGGLIFFDDYLWEEANPNGVDILRCPKPAIDAFTNIFMRKLKIIRAPLNQIYCQKISD